MTGPKLHGRLAVQNPSYDYPDDHDLPRFGSNPGSFSKGDSGLIIRRRIPVTLQAGLSYKQLYSEPKRAVL